MQTKTSLLAFALLALSRQTFAQNAHDFFRGDVFPPPKAAPAAWLQELHKADEFFNANISMAEFLPNTRLAWHNHPGGQVLLITNGVGYYQEKGKQKQIVRPGDVIQCAPGVEHWHGGSLESGLTYVAISPMQKGATIWGEPVTDDDYHSAAADKRSTVTFRKAGVAKAATLVKANAIFAFDVASTIYSPGESADWRKQTTGQLLILTDGSGAYQERDKPRQVLRKGDVITIAPDAEYSHGASSESDASYFEITPRKS